MYLVNGKWKSDEYLPSYGVRPNSRPGIDHREPENDIGMSQFGPDDPIVNSELRYPESSSWQYENSMDMDKYCKFLVDRMIISSAKYVSNCHSTTWYRGRWNEWMRGLF